MQRDIGNEIIVAIVAVAVLVFALTFGIILSLSNANSLENESPDGVVQSNVATEGTEGGDTPTEQPSLTHTIEPSITPTATQTATATESPVPTATVTHTTSPTFTATATQTESSTPTRRPSVTHTPVPSNTATDTPTRTTTPSPTSTDTAVPTATDMPSATATHKPTETMTATRTATRTPTRTPSQTPSPTRTATVTATRRVVPTVTPLASPAINTPTSEEADSTVCIAPFGWVEYVVRRGDSLFSIARATGSTIDALQEANCLENIDRIRVGEKLYVPGPSSGLVQPDDGSLSPQGCTDVGAIIVNPSPGALLRNVFVLRGNALDDNFSYYQIDVRPESATTYSFYSRSEQPVVNGTLGTIDPGIFRPGVYWIRLSVFNTSDQAVSPTCAIPMIFE